jgi:hypothetical protein
MATHCMQKEIGIGSVAVHIGTLSLYLHIEKLVEFA